MQIIVNCVYRHLKQVKEINKVYELMKKGIICFIFYKGIF